MTQCNLPRKVFRSAGEDVEVAKQCPDTEQTRSLSYRLAFADNEFLLRDELRPVRLQLELLKAELLLDEQGIHSTVAIFGSTRTPSREDALTNLESAKASAAKDPDDPKLIRALKLAERRLENSDCYEEARKLASLITEHYQVGGENRFVVVTGGGPGIMEAANRGAHESGGRSIGLNIILPFEQFPNAYVTPELSFQFHYFAIRKMHFLLRAKALVVCPGGFGTIDEMFETLTLIQTKKVARMPVLLLGQKYWERLINFEVMAEEGMINPEDLDLFEYVDSAEAAWQKIKGFYSID